MNREFFFQAVAVLLFVVILIGVKETGLGALREVYYDYQDQRIEKLYACHAAPSCSLSADEFEQLNKMLIAQQERAEARKAVKR